MGAAAPYIVAAVATAVSHQQQQRVLKRQDEIAAQGIKQQAKKGQEAARQVGEQAQRIERSQADTATPMQQFAEQLARTRPQTAAGLEGQFSSAYSEAAEEAKAGVSEYGQKFADLMARLDAPTRQRQAEGFEFGRLGTGLGSLGRDASAQDFLTRLRMQGVRPNPYAQMAAQIGQGYAQSQMGGN